MSMEDILKDPRTTWEEIRSAMRSQGHSTNGGIVMALVTAPVATLSRQEEHTAAPHAVETAAKKPEDNVEDEGSGSGSVHHSQLDDIFTLTHLDKSVLPVPVNFGFGGYKPCNTRIPAKNNPRRGITSEIAQAAINSSFNSAATYSVNSSMSSAPSVDMMDFGVDNEAVSYSMETLNEIESRRGSTSTCSITNENTSSCPTNAFLDWNHDDESSASAHADQHVSCDESCHKNDPDTHKLEQHSPAPDF